MKQSEGFAAVIAACAKRCGTDVDSRGSLHKLAQFCVPEMLQAIMKEKNVELLAAMVRDLEKSVESCVQVDDGETVQALQFFSPEETGHIITECQKLFGESLQRRAVRHAEAATNPDFDEEAELDLEQDDAADDKIRTNVRT